MSLLLDQRQIDRDVDDKAVLPALEEIAAAIGVAEPIVIGFAGDEPVERDLVELVVQGVRQRLRVDARLRAVTEPRLREACQIQRKCSGFGDPLRAAVNQSQLRRINRIAETTVQ